MWNLFVFTAYLPTRLLEGEPPLFLPLSLLLAQLARQSTRCLTMSAPKKAATLETLHFDNQALERLPVDKETKNYVRTVRLFWSSVC